MRDSLQSGARGRGGQSPRASEVGAFLAVGLIALTMLAAAVRLQAARERIYPPSDNEVEAMYLRSGPAIRRLAGAYATLASDGYWIRSIQYYGGTKRRREARPRAP